MPNNQNILSRRNLLGGAAAVVVSAVSAPYVQAAQFRGAVPVDQRAVDLLLRPNSYGLTDTSSLSGRTRVDPTTITGTCFNIVFIGQSTNNNSIVGTYTQVNTTAVLNGSLAHKGSVWQAAKPLLASDLTDDHHGRWLGDSLVTGGKGTKFVLWMSAMGGSLASYWEEPAGQLAYRIGLTARSIAAAGLSHLPTIVDWQQGEADTDSAISQAAHTTSLNNMIANCKRSGLLVAGRDVMFVHKCTRIAGLTASRNAIRAAQAAVCDGVLVREGADIDTLDASHRTDGTHFSMSGAAAQAALKYTVYDTWL